MRRFGPAKPMTREAELKAAIVDANLPPRDFKVFMVLMKKATWVTAEIKPQFQPRRLGELAAWCRMSEANVKRALNHLERHGWVVRHRHVTRKGTGGRSRPTSYQLEHGRDCDCPKRAQDEPDKGVQDEPVSGHKGAQDEPRKGLKRGEETAVQTPVPAKSVRDEEELEADRPVVAVPRSAAEEDRRDRPVYDEEWPPGTNGAAANLRPPVRGLDRLLTRLGQIVIQEGYGTDKSVQAALSIDREACDRLIGIAYKQKRVDRIGGFLVPPPGRDPASKTLDHITAALGAKVIRIENNAK